MTTTVYWNKSTFTQNETSSGFPAAVLIVSDDPNLTISAPATAFDTVQATLKNNAQPGADTLKDWGLLLQTNINRPKFTDNGVTVYPFDLVCSNWDAHQALGNASPQAYLETTTQPVITATTGANVNVPVTAATAPLHFASVGDVYMIDVDPAQHNPSWLSADTRVFQIKACSNTPGGAGLGFVGVNGAAINVVSGDPLGFLAQVLDALNNAGGDDAGLGAVGPASIFNALSANEDGSHVTTIPADSNGTKVYNFALARVSLLDNTNQPARAVQVFFRAFRSLNANLKYDYFTGGPNSAPPENYRRLSTNSSVPALGRLADTSATPGWIVSIPFYATARSADQTQQPADAPNVQTFPFNPPRPNRRTFYAGAYIDINNPQPFFPDIALPVSSDNNFNNVGPNNALKSIGDLLVQSHVCMVVEVNDPKNPTQDDANPNIFINPQNSETLAQRNLAFGPVTNEGAYDATRGVQKSFEFVPHVEPVAKGVYAKPTRDELLFMSKDGLPEGSTLELFMPGVDLDDNAKRHSHIKAHGENTISFALTKAARIQVPVDSGKRAPGLITLHIPPQADVGRTYVVDVLQLHPATGVVVGAFQIRAQSIKARVGVAVVRADEKEDLHAEKALREHEPKTLPPALAAWRAVLDRQTSFAAKKLHLTQAEATRDAGAGERSTIITLDKIELSTPVGYKKDAFRPRLVAQVFDGGVLVETQPLELPDYAEGIVPIKLVVFRGTIFDTVAVRIGAVGAGGIVERHYRAFNVAKKHDDGTGVSERPGPGSIKAWFSET